MHEPTIVGFTVARAQFESTCRRRVLRRASIVSLLARFRVVTRVSRAFKDRATRDELVLIVLTRESSATRPSARQNYRFWVYLPIGLRVRVGDEGLLSNRDPSMHSTGRDSLPSPSSLRGRKTSRFVFARLADARPRRATATDRPTDRAIVRRSSFVVRRSSFIVRRSSFVVAHDGILGQSRARRPRRRRATTDDVVSTRARARDDDGDVGDARDVGVGRRDGGGESGGGGCERML